LVLEGGGQWSRRFRPKENKARGRRDKKISGGKYKHKQGTKKEGPSKTLLHQRPSSLKG